MTMHKRFLFGSFLLLACGCNHMSNTDAGVLGGGAIGVGIAVGAVAAVQLGFY